MLLIHHRFLLQPTYNQYKISHLRQSHGKDELAQGTPSLLQWLSIIHDNDVYMLEKGGRGGGGGEERGVRTHREIQSAWTPMPTCGFSRSVVQNGVHFLACNYHFIVVIFVLQVPIAVDFWRYQRDTKRQIEKKREGECKIRTGNHFHLANTQQKLRSGFELCIDSPPRREMVCLREKDGGV